MLFQSQGAIEQKLNANIEVAALAIIRILKEPSPSDDLLDRIKGQVRQGLSPEQAKDPYSVLSSDVLARTSAVVAQVYGVDLQLRGREADAFGAGADAAKDDAKGSFFDALGRTPFDRRMSPSGVAGFYSGTSGYAGLSGSTWRPETGIAGLNPQNFASTPFAAAGLDLGTTKYLAAQGFSTTNIIHAAQDAKALGFDPKNKRMATDLATIDKHDPNAREFNRNAQDLRKKLSEDSSYQDLKKQLTETTDPAERRAIQEKMWKVENEHRKISGVDHDIDNTKDPRVKAAKKRVIDQVITDQRDKRYKIGNDAAADMDDAQKAQNAARGAAVTRSAKDSAARTTVAQNSADADSVFGAATTAPEKPAEKAPEKPEAGTTKKETSGTPPPAPQQTTKPPAP